MIKALRRSSRLTALWMTPLYLDAFPWWMPTVQTGTFVIGTTPFVLIQNTARKIYRSSKPTHPSSFTPTRSTRATTLWSPSTFVSITLVCEQMDISRLCRMIISPTYTMPVSELRKLSCHVRIFVCLFMTLCEFVWDYKQCWANVEQRWPGLRHTTQSQRSAMATKM